MLSWHSYLRISNFSRRFKCEVWCAVANGVLQVWNQICSNSEYRISVALQITVPLKLKAPVLEVVKSKTTSVIIQLVGGVAQWLGRPSLVGGLYLIYAYSLHVTTSWVRCPVWVNQPGKLSLPSLRVGKWVVIHVITWNYMDGLRGWRLDTIKRQTRMVYGW